MFLGVILLPWAGRDRFPTLGLSACLNPVHCATAAAWSEVCKIVAYGSLVLFWFLLCLMVLFWSR